MENEGGIDNAPSTSWSNANIKEEKSIEEKSRKEKRKKYKSLEDSICSYGVFSSSNLGMHSASQLTINESILCQG